MNKSEAYVLADRLFALADRRDESHSHMDDTTDMLRTAGAGLRALADNQLPEWDSITEPELTDSGHEAETLAGWSAEAQSGKVSWTLLGAARVMGYAAQWIKARDQEIATLRTSLAKALPPPQAFEPKSAQAPTYEELRGEALCACHADFYLEKYSGGASPSGLHGLLTMRVTNKDGVSIPVEYIRKSAQAFESGDALRAHIAEFQKPGELPYSFIPIRKGEFIDARRLGGAVPDDRAPSECDPLPDPFNESAAALAKAFDLFRSEAASRAEHQRAMEHQTRRIADANALRALSVADKLETVEGEALLSRIRSDALK